MTGTSAIKEAVSSFVGRKEEIGASEVAAFLIEEALAELEISAETYAGTQFLKPLLHTGAMDWARNILKRPTIVEEVLNGGTQEELFPEFGEFVRYRQDADGDWRFKRRRALLREEYEASLNLLREKSRELIEKIDRYQDDYNTALPVWSPGLTFGEAFRLASPQGGAHA
jgi:hypothetical protein